MVRTDITEKDTGGSLVSDLLVEVLETPHRLTVYIAVQTFGSGTPEEVAGRTVLPVSVVASTLDDPELDGLVERGADGRYSVAGPVQVLQKR